jgi:hypothetical protein
VEDEAPLQALQAPIGKNGTLALEFYAAHDVHNNYMGINGLIYNMISCESQENVKLFEVV